MEGDDAALAYHGFDVMLGKWLKNGTVYNAMFSESTWCSVSAQYGKDIKRLGRVLPGDAPIRA